MKEKGRLACLLLAAGLLASAFLFSGFERSDVRVQAGERPSPKGSGKEFTDIMNWSWNLSAFGYVGSVSVILKKEVTDQRSGKTEELSF